MVITRRAFCSLAAPLLLAPRHAAAQDKPTDRPDVAAIDHDRILKSATPLLTQSPTPLTAAPCTRSPGTPHDFYSEPEDAGLATPFTTHRDALTEASIAISSLTAASLITHDPRYAQLAAAHIRAWFIAPATAMTPSLALAQTLPPAKAGRPEGVLEGIHLCEIFQSIPFLATAEALTSEDLSTLAKWAADYLDWLNTSRMAGLARDTKSHLGTAWLFQACAMAHANPTDDRPLTTLRHFFHSTTLRAQINSDGIFMHELTTPNPYRNCLFNVDMMAAICTLLTTRFESAWEYELDDGPGMRAAIAHHFPYIADRKAWPYRADAALFNLLPIRPPSLLFAARVYQRPEYATLWRSLPPDPPARELEQVFPIRQPILWVTRPRP